MFILNYNLNFTSSFLLGCSWCIGVDLIQEPEDKVEYPVGVGQSFLNKTNIDRNISDANSKFNRYPFEEVNPILLVFLKDSLADILEGDDIEVDPDKNSIASDELTETYKDLKVINTQQSICDDPKKNRG
jgi:hypothetical protein